jgi:hypothetical protein
MGTNKQGILVAVERGGGQVRAALIQSSSIINIGTELRHMVAKSAHLMTDENPAYRMIGKLYTKHEAVKHKGAIYAVGNVHNNTAESFNATLERAKIGVFHWMSKDHMTRYVAKAVYCWNTRGEVRPVHQGAFWGTGRRAGGWVARQAAQMDDSRRNCVGKSTS